MIYIPSYSHDPADNLAYEQYLLEHVVIDKPILFFYINKPSVIIGRHQNTIEQINLDYLYQHNIDVVRRMSGGGAVYHDYGNLNYSFIYPSNERMLDFQTLTKPIISVLHKMGANNVKLSGRNDIEVDGLKFSGTAMYQKNNKILLHGTLLYNSDLSEINNILKVKKSKIVSKGVKSVRSRVTNLNSYLDVQYQDLSTKEFQNTLIKYLSDDINILDDDLSINTLQKINDIKLKYYNNYNWNFGGLSDWTYKNSQKYDFGEVELAIELKGHNIAKFKIYGDYFANRDISDLEKKFIGSVYEPKVVENILQTYNLQLYLPKMTNEEFLLLCFE